MKNKTPVFTFDRKSCCVIGEVAQAHDGSLGTAHAYIDAIAAAGADAVKFQTHIAEAESTPGEPWRIKFSPQDRTRFDYWKRMEFSAEQWHGLKQHAEKTGLLFLSSPFSLEAVEMLSKLDMCAWKIASGEVSNRRFLDAILNTRKPVLLSTGMSTLAEIDLAIDLIRKQDVAFAVLQCSSIYPTPAEKVGLNMLNLFRQRYDCPVGLSDHSGNIYAGLAAATLGIEMLEVHVTLSRESFGADVTSSVTTVELKQLVQGVRSIERMKANPLDKNQMAAELESMRKLFNKSVVATKDLPAGAVLTLADMTVKKPGCGIPAARLEELVGRKTRKAISRNTFVLDESLESAYGFGRDSSH